MLEVSFELHVALHLRELVFLLSIFKLADLILRISLKLQILTVLLLHELLSVACFLILFLEVLSLALDDGAPLVVLAVVDRVVPLLVPMQLVDSLLLLLEGIVDSVGVELQGVQLNYR